MYDIQAIFKVTISADWKKNTKNTVYLDKGDLTFSKSLYNKPKMFNIHRPALINLIQDVAIQLANASGLNVTSAFKERIRNESEEIVNFESKLGMVFLNIILFIMISS